MSLIVRKGVIAILYKVMIEGCVRVSWRTDSDRREVEIVNGVGGD